MAMTGNTQGGVTSDINVTPLADVMLVLLIIFMVITPLLQKGVDVKLPEAQYPTDHPDSEDTVNLAIKADRTIYLDMIPVAESELVTRVRDKFEGRAERTIFLKADENLDYGDVLRIMDMVREGGVEQIGLITEVKIDETG